jgi:hypothetical protein
VVDNIKVSIKWLLINGAKSFRYRQGRTLIGSAPPTDLNIHNFNLGPYLLRVDSECEH